MLSEDRLHDYKTGSTIDSLFGNGLENNNAIAFESYNALYGKIKLEYTPHQRYIREPKEKIILGSKWPTFYTTWRKGISGIFNSKVDFDYWDVGHATGNQLWLAGHAPLQYKQWHFP
ncbi:MAG: DUF5686 family protein [Segetibacter sp.]